MTEATPKLRSDLIVRAEQDGERTVYVIKDPLTGRFYRLRAPEYYLLSRCDGNTSAAQAAALTGERFGIQLDGDAASAFLARMERLLFFEGPAVERLTARSAAVLRGNRRRSVWSITVKAFDPDPLLARWTPRLRFLFTPASVDVGLLLMIVAGLIALAQGSIWGAGVVEIWRLTSIPLFLAAILSIAFVHEFGHALTLKHYGGSVHEMGFLLLYFQPCFYCNISDSYLVSGRRARACIGLAGLFFQGLLTAVAIVLWRVLETGNLLSQFLWVLIAVSLAVWLFNLNPLIRLDGYYLLVDWLNIPNLRRRAFSWWRGMLRHWLLGREGNAVAALPRQRRIFFWYGFLAAVYTIFLVGFMLYHVTRLVHHHWGWAGILGVYGAVLLMTLTSRSATADQMEPDQTVEKSAAQSTVTRSRRRKPLWVWGGLVIVLIALALIPGQRRVGSPCEVQAGSRFTVTTPGQGTLEATLIVGDSPAGTDGVLPKPKRSILQAGAADFSAITYELRVREGDRVAVGDTLVVLSSNRYQTRLAGLVAQKGRIAAQRNLLVSGPKKDAIVELRAQIAEAQAQVDNKQLELQRSERMRERDLISQQELETKRTELERAQAQKQSRNAQLALLISEPKAEELAIKEAEIAELDAEIGFLAAQIAASTTTSPIAGSVTRVDRGGTLVEVADLDPVRLELQVDERDIADVRTENPVTLKVRPLPFFTFRGRVTQIAADADTSGGKRRFLVTTQIENSDGHLKPGMTGHAKIACGRQSLLSLILRRLVHFVRVEFWSWW